VTRYGAASFAVFILLMMYVGYADGLMRGMDIGFHRALIVVLMMLGCLHISRWAADKLCDHSGQEEEE